MRNGSQERGGAPDVHRGASFVSLKQAPSRFVCRLGLFFLFPTAPALLRGKVPCPVKSITNASPARRGKRYIKQRGRPPNLRRVEETKGYKRYIKQKGRPPHVDTPLLFPYHYPLGLKRWRDEPYLCPRPLCWPFLPPCHFIMARGNFI